MFQISHISVEPFQMGDTNKLCEKMAMMMPYILSTKLSQIRQ